MALLSPSTIPSSPSPPATSCRARSRRRSPAARWSLLAPLAGRRLTAWVAYVALARCPRSGVFPNGPQLAADRYSYSAGSAAGRVAGGARGAVGVAGLAAGRRADRAIAARGAALAALGPALVGLTALTERQIAVWRDSVTLWRHAALGGPESDIPLFYLGWALAEAGRFDEARAHFEAALGAGAHEPPGAARPARPARRRSSTQQAGRPAADERRLREALTLDRDHPVAWITSGRLHGGRAASAARPAPRLRRARPSARDGLAAVPGLGAASGGRPTVPEDERTGAGPPRVRRSAWRSSSTAPTWRRRSTTVSPCGSRRATPPPGTTSA